MALAAGLAAPVAAAPIALDCEATRACVANLDAACDATRVSYQLDVGEEVGDKVVLTTDEGDRFYEFRRLAGAEGVVLQAAGGALESDQGAGAMTVFKDLRFVLTRHGLLALEGDEVPPAAVSISVFGTCTPRE
ncbi:hypothetical protein [Rhodovulum sp. ES.010]|uniref:hypothetical protein n=1 Tax=Rhodovulum sp. ES.010 TaxID=1882821 RepID=UPI000940B988|nr:hypothetical protein [Rhodovulum sp. ES.010]